MLLAPYANSIIANCEYNSGSWIYAGSVYYCYIQGIKVDTPENWITKVRGSHDSGKTNNDVNAVWIEYSPDCLYVPKGFEKFFRNIKSLGLTDTGLLAITPKDLQPFPELIELQLQNNKLTALGTGLFDFNAKLINLYFEGNQIRSIAVDLLDPIPNLKHATFNENICINMSAETPEEVKALKKELKSKCHCNNQNLFDKIAFLENNFALLQLEFFRLKAEINASTQAIDKNQ